MKTKHIGKRMLAIFFALAFCLTLLPMSVMAAGETTFEEGTITDGGKYLIVGAISDNSATIMKRNGTNGVTTQTVPVSSGKIVIDESTYADCIWTAAGGSNAFSMSNGGYYLKDDGYGIGQPAVTTTSTATSMTWNGSNFTAFDMAMRYNGSAFIFYSYGDAVKFYKAAAAPSTPTVDSVTVTPASASVSVGGTTTLSATVNGSEGVSQEVTWSTANPSIATVNDSGVVTGVGAGEIAITATSKADNTKFGTCMVAVTETSVPVTGVTLDQHNLTLTAGGATATLTAMIAPENATDKRLEWVSGDINVATVDNNGVVTPVGEGKTIIGVMAVTGANDSCEVTVSAAPTPAGKTYALADTIQDGKNYLIVSSNVAGSAFALKNDNGVANAAVEIADGKITANDASIVWKATGTTSSFTLENGSGAFLQRSTNDLTIGGSATSWNWNGTRILNGDRAVMYGQERSEAEHFGLVYTGYIPGTFRNVYFFEEQAATKPAFTTKQLVLSGQIGVIFKMDLSMLSAEQRADSAMEFEVASEEGARAAVTYDAYDETTGIATYTCYVNALQMADEITATFTYDDDKEVVATASVKEYVDYIIEHGSEAEYSRYVELAKAIKDYGHYAQEYLASVHDFTIGTDYAAMDPYHTSLTRPADEALQAFKPSFNKGENDVTGLALKLSLDSETALTIRPVVSGGAELTGGVTFAGKTIDFADGKAKVEGIKASQLAANVTISGSAGGTLTGSASALSYAYVVLKGGSSDAKLQNLAIALYNYYVETSKL